MALAPITLVLFNSSSVLPRLRAALANFPNPEKIVVLHRGHERPTFPADLGVSVSFVNDFTPEPEKRVVVVFEPTLALLDSIRVVMDWSRKLPNQIECFTPTSDDGLESAALIGEVI